jgi:hypothetical protein
VYGNLLIAAATPAARRDRHDEAAEYINLAETAATRSGPVRAYGSAFSVTDVRTQAVNVALAGQENRPQDALTLAARVDLDAITRPVHRASHRVDVAHAQYATGDCDGALATLLEVEQSSRSGSGTRPSPRQRCGRCWRRSASATRRCGGWRPGWVLTRRYEVGRCVLPGPYPGRRLVIPVPVP